MSRTRRAMRLSVAEVLFFSLMVGSGEAYFVADAVRFRATPFEIALLVTLPPFVGAIGPFVGLFLLDRMRRRRVLVTASAFLQSLTLFSIALVDAGPTLLIALSSAYHLFGRFSGTLWSSWYGDLVPSRIRGRYFSQRLRVAQVATASALVASGLVLQFVEPSAPGLVAPGGGGSGFQILFLAAGIFRLVSCVLLALAWEPAWSAGASSSGPPRLEHAWSLPRVVWLVLASAGLLHLTVYVGSPHFSPFMLEQLHFSYAEYMVASVAVIGTKFLALPAWGRTIDRYGARSCYFLALMLIAFVPLPFVWATGLGLVLVGQVLSGIAWGGHELAEFSLLLELTDRASRPRVFAVLSAANGTAQLLGGMAGAPLLGPLGFAGIFATTFVLRLLVALVTPALVPAAVGAPTLGRRAVLLRMIGVRPSGGIVHRLISGDD